MTFPSQEEHSTKYLAMGIMPTYPSVFLPKNSTSCNYYYNGTVTLTLTKPGQAPMESKPLEPEIKCSTCKRTFKTERGCKIHEKRVHQPLPPTEPTGTDPPLQPTPERDPEEPPEEIPPTQDQHHEYRKFGKSWYRFTPGSYVSKSWLKLKMVKGEPYKCFQYQTPLDVENKYLGHVQCPDPTCGALYKVTNQHIITIEYERISEDEYANEIKPSTPEISA